MISLRSLRGLRKCSDTPIPEGGFQTRPYESRFFFAFFAPFAVNTPNPNFFYVNYVPFVVKFFLPYDC